MRDEPAQVVGGGVERFAPLRKSTSIRADSV
jgi:hypothetical protein